MRPKMLILLLCIVNLTIPVVKGQVTFIIKSLPNTTPEEDTIFICGSFNNWNVHDIKHILRPQLDGTYSITLPAYAGSIEYKFSRGSWLKVETNGKNEYMPNRKYTFGTLGKVYIQIENWQDLGGLKHFNYLVLFLFAAAFYGLILLFLVYRIQKPNSLKLRSFFACNTIVIVTLFGAVIHSQSNIIGQAHIGMLGYLVFFGWGPTFAFYLYSLLNQKNIQRYYLHYIPVLVVALVDLLRMLNFKPFTILSTQVNSNLSVGSSALILLGIVLNLYYHARLFAIIQWKSADGEKLPKEVMLVNILYLISCITVLSILLNYVLLLCNTSWGILMNFEAPMVIISGIIIVEFYYFWKFPEILRDKVVPFSVSNAEALIERLDDLMMLEKPYKNPELNIAELSDMLDTKPHILSKVINERFNKNYRDFINEYRVNEFIKISTSEAYKNYTFLALAHEVGFNSKSTFNLAFKKITKLSPRDYLKQKRSFL